MAIHTCFSLIPCSLTSPKLPFPQNNNFQSPIRTLCKPTFSFDRKVQFQNGAVPSVGEDFPIDYADWLPKRDPSDRRRAGILLHPTSFPGPYGIGDLGPQAFRFLDWLHLAGCSLWQVLPLVPPGKRGNEDGSPYSGQDANCGNTLLISLEELVDDGLLKKEELPQPIPTDRVNYSTIADIKDPLITKAAKRLLSSEGELKDQLENFRGDPNISSKINLLYFLIKVNNRSKDNHGLSNYDNDSYSVWLL